MQRQHLHKTTIAVIVAGFFSMGASSAFAQMTPQTADMTVTGTIVPAACSASFDGGGIVDFGRIKLVDLPANAYYQMVSKTASLNVTCSADKRVAFQVQDMQADSRMVGAEMRNAVGVGVDGQIFGLGKGDMSGTITEMGGYSLVVSAPTVDGSPKAAIYSTDNGLRWNAGAGPMYFTGGALVTAGNGTTPVLGKNFVFPMTIRAALNYGSRMQASQDTPLNGQSTFTISYQ